VTVIGQCDMLTLQGIPSLLWNLKFITTFTRAHYWTLSWVKWYHSTSCTHLVKFHINITLQNISGLIIWRIRWSNYFV